MCVRRSTSFYACVRRSWEENQRKLTKHITDKPYKRYYKQCI